MNTLPNFPPTKPNFLKNLTPAQINELDLKIKKFFDKARKINERAK